MEMANESKTKQKMAISYRTRNKTKQKSWNFHNKSNQQPTNETNKQTTIIISPLTRKKNLPIECRWWWRFFSNKKPSKQNSNFIGRKGSMNIHFDCWWQIITHITIVLLDNHHYEIFLRKKNHSERVWHSKHSRERERER